MGSVIDLNTRRGNRRRDSAPPSNRAGEVVCTHCGERHPFVRLTGGETRCLTAFFDGAHWFCLNRGCRRAWMEGRPAIVRPE
jgi:hypothetical protein